MVTLKPKRRIRAALSIVLGIAGVILLTAGAISAFLDRISETFDASAQRLIYHTDHAAVLQACREVIANPQAFGFPKGEDGSTVVNGSQGGGPVPPAVPAVLKNLDFEFMDVQGDRATIWFGSGFGHWGFRTFSAKGDSQIEVVPGLWFWTEGRIPRDPSKFPYYRTSKRLLIGGALVVGAAIALTICSRQLASRSARG